MQTTAAGCSRLCRWLVKLAFDETGTAAAFGMIGGYSSADFWEAAIQARATRRKNRAAPHTGCSAELAAASALRLVAPAGNMSACYQRVKRLLDVCGAAALLVILSPMLLAVLGILALTTGGKPIFSQERVGLCGRRFRMWKFRTMRLDADQFQHLVQNDKDGPIFKNRHDPRITKIGRILRKTSIDELPQLLNVLLGDMSLVGPRPPVPKEVAKYKAWQKRRLSVKPGLTCKWQISGRSDVGFEDWVRMDLWYVQHQDLRTDLELLVRTPLKVISCEGAY